MDSAILLSVLNLLKEGVSVIFVLLLLEHFTPDLSGVFELTTSLESTVPGSMSTISVSQKLDVSIKGSTVNKKVFPFLSVLLKLKYNIQEGYFSSNVCFF